MRKFHKFLIMISALAMIIAVFLVADNYIGVFSSPKVKNVTVDSLIIINFDKPVNRQEILHGMVPETPGEWKFENPLIGSHLYRTMVFTPAIGFEPDMQYYVSLENIKGFGLAKPGVYHFGFRTNPAAPTNELKSNSEPDPGITFIEAPFFWQESRLSCEAASLRMALAVKGVFVSENEIMAEIGTDSSPRKGNIWGDPYEIFVGDINGKICTTGYGVYWDPVAKAASVWRKSEAKTGWNLPSLINELKSGNPVIFWGVLPTGNLTDCSWQTKDGKYIKAWKEDHVRTIVGFIGTPENPEKIIIHDPLSGVLYWPTEFFMENWKTFEYSAVVIR